MTCVCLRYRSIVICVFALLCGGIVASADVFNMPAGLKNLETVVMGNPGNKADDTGFVASFILLSKRQ